MVKEEEKGLTRRTGPLTSIMAFPRSIRAEILFRLLGHAQGVCVCVFGRHDDILLQGVFRWVQVERYMGCKEVVDVVFVAESNSMKETIGGDVDGDAEFSNAPRVHGTMMKELHCDFLTSHRRDDLRKPPPIRIHPNVKPSQCSINQKMGSVGIWQYTIGKLMWSVNLAVFEQEVYIIMTRETPSNAKKEFEKRKFWYHYSRNP
jgi:hypothetical protein